MTSPLCAIRRLVADTRNRCVRSREDEGSIDGSLRPIAQNPDCALLQLPVDVILLISQALSSASRALLSQTCCSLRAVLGSHSAATLERHQRLEYLAGVARDLPERWVCEACVKLHRVVNLDTPKEPQHMSCPLGWDSWRHRAYHYRRHRLDSRLVRLDHRHVQLALKYTRLRDEGHREYLQKLLEPYRDDNFVTHIYPCRPGVLAARYLVYPKVVVGADNNLRYMTLSTWLYHTDIEPISPFAVGDLYVCPHLCFLHSLWLKFGPVGRVGAVIHAALETQGASGELFGACPRCHTDFSVRASQDHVELSVWQDLGPEGHPENPAWLSQNNMVRQETSNANLEALALAHEPGSVRRLYYSGGCEAGNLLRLHDQKRDGGN
ncbi:hypothetical protein GGS23DRAFT_581756 [Durotheca rogersii]|uniref:uncharacterized protein n=1 Tax=Durotheca rogersii TaxID=419775 RepID=UPI00221F2654|nr:uncharacterized protein GGS23DRAFT_581756 [Durotheca rogersii]KAI5860243.1 hypothetical protein GGS23DRAFT_581756 [Durotheca rogersii]